MLSEFHSHNVVQAASRLNSFWEGQTTPCRCCDPVSRETEDSMQASVVNRWEVDMSQRSCSPAVEATEQAPIFRGSWTTGGYVNCSVYLAIETLFALGKLEACLLR